MRLDILPRISDIQPAEWDDLVWRTSAPVFYTHSLMLAYELAPLQSAIQCRYLVGRSEHDGSLRCVLPVYIQEDMDPLGVLHRMKPPGMGVHRPRGVLTHFWHCYDTRCPMLDPSKEALVLLRGALKEIALRSDSDWYGFVNVDGSGPLPDALKAVGFTVSPMWNRFVLDLTTFLSIDDYIQLLERKPRYELRRQWRRACEAGVEIEVTSRPFGNLDAVVQLCRDTARRYAAAESYPEGNFARFLDIAGPSVRIVTVSLAGHLLSAWVCFVHEHTFHTWAAGARYDLTRFSPYYIGYLACVREAIGARFRTMEGGRGNATLKRRFGLQPRLLYTALATL